MKAKIQYVVITILMMVILVFVMKGCNSFKPVQIKGYTPECNDLLTFIKYTAETKGKQLDTIIKDFFEACRKSREMKNIQYKEDFCRTLVFGQNGRINMDSPKYSVYLQCMKMDICSKVKWRKK